jgi:hypothetical protein
MQYLPISAVPHPQKDPKSHPPSLYLKSRAPTAVPPPPFPPALTSALTSPPPHSLCLKYQHPITLVFPSANMFKARVSVSPLCILSRNPASAAPHWTITTAHPPVSALGLQHFTQPLVQKCKCSASTLPPHPPSRCAWMNKKAVSARRP